MPPVATSAETTHEPLIGVAEVARLLNVSQDTVRRLARSGRLPAIRVGAQLRFDKGVLLAPTVPNGRRGGVHPDNHRLR